MNTPNLPARKPDSSHIRFLELWINRFSWVLLIGLGLTGLYLILAVVVSFGPDTNFVQSGASLYLSQAKYIFGALTSVFSLIFCYLASQVVSKGMRYLIAYRQEIQSKKAKPAGPHA
jgi:hypothetical protein